MDVDCDLKDDTGTVVPTKSDSDVIFCLQLKSKTVTCTHSTLANTNR